MENSVIGVYDSYTQAQKAMNELLASGIPRNDMQLNPSEEPSAASTATHEDTGHGIGHFFRSLFGMEDDTERTGDMYAEAVRRGSCVLVVDADNEDQRTKVIEVMNRFDPIDIEERAMHWRSQGWTGYDEAAPRYSDAEIEQERTLYTRGTQGMQGDKLAAAVDKTGEETRIPVVEEQLRVGKREVERGGVRVFKRVSEKPVHESVNLREEHVKVERHPVDQPASEADMAAFKEGSVEMRETSEEPVVEKTARIIEEVVVGKEVSQQKADINDTVRRTDVEVEQLGAKGATPARTGATTGTTAGTTAGTMTGDDADFRRHWQDSYGTSGGRYEDYDAAYRYGSSMAGTERFKNYRWDDAEPQMRTDWERQHPESTWEKVKDAVRYGAERVTGNRH